MIFERTCVSIYLTLLKNTRECSLVKVTIYGFCTLHQLYQCLELHQMDNMCRVHLEFHICACGQHTHFKLSLCPQGSIIHSIQF
jgi:hypothetical protein